MTENKLAVNANSKVFVESSMTEYCDFALSDAKKILSVTAHAAVTGCEALNNELKVSLRTMFTVVYTTDSGIAKTESAVDNYHSIVKEGIPSSARCSLRASVCDCEYSGLGSVKGKASVEIIGYYVAETSMNFLDASRTDIMCKTSGVEVESICLLNDAKTSLTNTFEARMPLNTILDSSAYAVVNNVYPMSAAYQIEGEFCLRIVALTDNNQYITQVFSQSFSCDISDERVTQNSILDTEAYICEYSLNITESDRRLFVCDAEIRLCATVTDTVSIEGVTDVYSLTHELQTEKTTSAFDTNFCYRAIREKVGGNIESEENINEICFVSSPDVSVNLGVYSDNLSAEGLVTAKLVYLDENNVLSSMPVELPYKVQLPKDGNCDRFLKPTVTVTNINARLRTTREVDITAELFISVRGVAAKELCLISEVIEGELKEIDDYAISLYIVKPNETLWEVAKALNVSENVILELNTDIKLPLKGGEKILIYKPLAVDI